jgi:hypothetical protein
MPALSQGKSWRTAPGSGGLEHRPDLIARHRRLQYRCGRRSEPRLCGDTPDRMKGCPMNKPRKRPTDRCPESADGAHKPSAERTGSGRGIVVDDDRGVVVATIFCGACWREGNATFAIEAIDWRDSQPT